MSKKSKKKKVKKIVKEETKVDTLDDVEKLDEELLVSEDLGEEVLLSEDSIEEVSNDETTNLSKKPSKKKIILFSSVSLVLVILLGLIFLFPIITLKGKKNVLINYKEKYREAGYSASFLGRDLTKKVKVSGRVNSTKLGKYKIVYEAKGIFKRKIVRTVIVADKSSPVITFSSDDDIYLCPGATYKDDSYKAYDNYDGDITKKVKVKYYKDKVVYSVFDSSGNKRSVSRKLIYKDVVYPELTLNNGDIKYLFVGDTYNDDGAIATDNCDHDISSKIQVSGDVNTSSPGEYEITYTVSDSALNKTEKKKKVIVSERGRNGTIYLTFDDGPKEGTTNIILDILKEQGIKATFFVTNGGPDELIKRAYDEGHSIGLHTASHNYATVYASVDSYFNDLNLVGDRVRRITGLDSKIIRFPGGSSNTVSRRYSVGIMSTLTSMVIERGYRYYDWNLSSGDASGRSGITAADIYNNVVGGLRKDRVNMVLMHDIKPYTRDALRDIIIYGKNNGYSFEKIDVGTEMVKQRVNN